MNNNTNEKQLDALSIMRELSIKDEIDTIISEVAWLNCPDIDDDVQKEIKRQKKTCECIERAILECVNYYSNPANSSDEDYGSRYVFKRKAVFCGKKRIYSYGCSLRITDILNFFKFFEKGTMKYPKPFFSFHKVMYKEEYYRAELWLSTYDVYADSDDDDCDDNFIIYGPETYS